VNNKPEKIERRDVKRLKPRQIPLLIGLWIVSSILSLLDWIVLRAAVASVAAVIAGSVPIEQQIERQWYLRWTVRAVDPCNVAILTTLAFLSIIGFDQLYRDAIWKKKIRKTFTIVTAIQVGILIVSWLAMTIAARFA
jgi:hypothetical protein